MGPDARSWIADAALACLAVAVIALSGWVVARDPEPPGDRSRTAAQTDLSPAQQTGAADAGPLSLLVLGDESVRGDRSAGRWVTELADGDNEVDNRARPESGYVTDGRPVACGLPACPSLTRMLDVATKVTDAPDVVLLSAGVHDAALPEARLRQGLTTFFDTLRSAYPDAELVVLAPLVREGAVPPGLGTVARLLSVEAERMGAEYVDAGQPYLDAKGADEAKRVAAAGDQLRDAVDEVLSS